MYHGFGEGLAYVRRSIALRNILLLAAVMCTAGMSFSVLLPLVAADWLGGAEGTYGLLTVAVGVGAMSGALLLIYCSGRTGLERWLVAAPMIFAAALLTAPLVVERTPMLLLLAVAGFGIIMTLGVSSILLQQRVDDDKRGRVMSLFLTAFMGLPPVGSLLVGAIAGRFGLTAALCTGATCCLAGAVTFGRACR